MDDETLQLQQQLLLLKKQISLIEEKINQNPLFQVPSCAVTESGLTSLEFSANTSMEPPQGIYEPLYEPSQEVSVVSTQFDTPEFEDYEELLLNKVHEVLELYPKVSSDTNDADILDLVQDVLSNAPENDVTIKDFKKEQESFAAASIKNPNQTIRLNEYLDEPEKNTITNPEPRENGPVKFIPKTPHWHVPKIEYDSCIFQDETIIEVRY